MVRCLAYQETALASVRHHENWGIFKRHFWGECTRHSHHYATDAEGEHVANVVPGDALACLDCSFDGPLVVRFRHQDLLLLR